MKPHHDNLLVLILEKILREEEKQTQILERLTQLVHKDIRLDEEILHLVKHPSHRYTINLKEITMPVGTVTPGTPATIAAQLLDNGAPIALPAGSTFAYTADDTLAVLTPSADTTSVNVLVNAGDPSTSVTITATTTAPDGTPATGTITIPVTVVAQQFTIQLTQTA